MRRVEVVEIAVLGEDGAWVQELGRVARGRTAKPLPKAWRRPRPAPLAKGKQATRSPIGADVLHLREGAEVGEQEELLLEDGTGGAKAM